MQGMKPWSPLCMTSTALCLQSHPETCIIFNPLEVSTELLKLRQSIWTFRSPRHAKYTQGLAWNFIHWMSLSRTTEKGEKYTLKQDHYYYYFWPIIHRTWKVLNSKAVQSLEMKGDQTLPYEPLSNWVCSQVSGRKWKPAFPSQESSGLHGDGPQLP